MPVLLWGVGGGTENIGFQWLRTPQPDYYKRGDPVSTPLLPLMGSREGR